MTEQDPWKNPILSWAVPIKVEYYYMQICNYVTTTGKIPTTLEEMRKV